MKEKIMKMLKKQFILKLMQYSEGQILNEYNPKVIKTFAICLAALIILSIINGVAHLVTSAFSFNNDVNINETYNSDINNIKIDVGTTNMVIKYGDTFSITAENVSKEFKIKEEGNNFNN